MRRKAEHQISDCYMCKGTGKILGPKQVELIEEDRDLWQVLQLLHKEEKRLTSVGTAFSYACGFVLVLWLVSMREKGYVGYVICTSLLLYSVMNILLLVRKKEKGVLSEETGENPHPIWCGKRRSISDNQSGRKVKGDAFYEKDNERNNLYRHHFYCSY